jgi:hypothetical protein
MSLPKQLMAGAAAVVAAGGAGVFIDNSGLAHGATDWRTLFHSADDGGVYWAFVSTVRGDNEFYSVGMQILGFRDAVIPQLANQEHTYQALHSFLGYSAFSGATIRDGEVVTDPVLPALRIRPQPHDRTTASRRRRQCSTPSASGDWNCWTLRRTKPVGRRGRETRTTHPNCALPVRAFR